jgi:predicted transcriptional regulator
MTDQRLRLKHAISDNPGIHFNGLVRRLNLANGQVQFHLYRLLGDGAIVQEELYGRTHYYPPETGEFERGAFAVLRRETARDILVVLIDEERARPKSVAEALDIARSTLEWHLNHLVEQRLVIKHRDDQNRVLLVPNRPADTLQMLADIEPSLSDRLVDRFTRLVDQFLSE